MADLLQLALDEHLVISVHLVNHAKVKLGKIKPFRDVELLTLPPLPRKGDLPGEPPKEVKVPAGMLMDDSITALTEDTPFLCFEEGVVSIEGVWDLAMLGGDRHDIAHELQQLTGGPAVTLVSLEGSFLKNEAGTYASIQDRFEDSYRIGEDGKKIKVRGSYYPAGGLPDDAPLVVRTSELSRFIAHLSDGEAGQRELGDRERATLLNTIGALLQYSGDKESAIIDALLTRHPGVPGLTKRTLEAKFAEAKRSLTSR